VNLTRLFIDASHLITLSQNASQQVYKPVPTGIYVPTI